MSEEKRRVRPPKSKSDSSKYDPDETPVDSDAAAIAMLESSGKSLGFEEPPISYLTGAPSMPDFDSSPVGTPSKQSALELADLQVQSLSPVADSALLDAMCDVMPKDWYKMLFTRLRWNQKLCEADIWRIMQSMASRVTRECHSMLRMNAAQVASMMRTSGRGINFGDNPSIRTDDLAQRYCADIRPKARKDTPPA